MEAEESDVTVESFPVTVYTSDSEAFDTVIADAFLEIDGEVFDDYTSTTSTTTSDELTTDTTVVNVLTFDIDGDLVIDADSEVEGSLVLKFQSQEDYAVGTLVRADITTDNVDDIEAEGADDIAEADLKGSAVGEEHTLLTEGLFAEAVSMTSDLIENTDTSTTDDEAEFTLKFDVTAFEEDFFIPYGAERGTTAGTSSGVTFIVENANNNTVITTGTTSAISLSSTADRDDTNDVFRVNAGDTETFTLTFLFDADSEASVRAQLYQINFKAEAAAVTAADASPHLARPEEEFETTAEPLE
jgi:hypothetical protein